MQCTNKGLQSQSRSVMDTDIRVVVVVYCRRVQKQYA